MRRLWTEVLEDLSLNFLEYKVLRRGSMPGGLRRAKPK
jgi:hypothetical protein